MSLEETCSDVFKKNDWLALCSKYENPLAASIMDGNLTR